VLVHDLGKALTPRSQWPSHRGHEKCGLAAVEAVCERLHAPAKYRKLALAVCEFHLHHHRLPELKPATALNLLEKLDAFRQPENARLFALCCTADLRGREGLHESDCPQADLLAAYHRTALEVDAGAVAAEVMGDGDHPRHPRSLLSGGGDGVAGAADGDLSRHPRSPLSRHPRSLLSGGGDGDGDDGGDGVADGDGDTTTGHIGQRIKKAIRRRRIAAIAAVKKAQAAPVIPANPAPAATRA